MTRAVSAAPAVMDGSAEKAAVPHLPPPLRSAHSGYAQGPNAQAPRRAKHRLSASDKDIAGDTTQSNKNTLTKGHKTWERRPPWSETTPETQRQRCSYRDQRGSHTHIPPQTLIGSRTLRSSRRNASTTHTPPVSPRVTETQTWIPFTHMYTHTHPSRRHTQNSTQTVCTQRDSSLLPPTSQVIVPLATSVTATVPCP